MKKRELTNKTTVKFANGMEGMVSVDIKGSFIHIFSGIIIDLSDYDDNLKCKFDNNLDIVDIQTPEIKKEYADMLNQLEGLLGLAYQVNNSTPISIELSRKTITYLPGIIEQFKKFSKS